MAPRNRHNLAQTEPFDKAAVKTVDIDSDIPQINAVAIQQFLLSSSPDPIFPVRFYASSQGNNFERPGISQERSFCAARVINIGDQRSSARAIVPAGSKTPKDTRTKSRAGSRDLFDTSGKTSRNVRKRNSRTADRTASRLRSI